MKVGILAPGGLDRSGTRRVIPALLWLIERLARVCEVHAFALAPAGRGARYPLAGATVHAIGAGLRPARAAAAIVAEHRRRPFDVLHAFWATRCGSLAVPIGRTFGIPTIVHLAGGETADLPEIAYGDMRTARGRALLRRILQGADRVTAPSAPIAAAAERLGGRPIRLPLGVDRTAWPVRPPRPRSARGPARLVHVASLNRVKDPLTLITALERLARRHHVTLDVAGEDTMRGLVHAAVQRSGLAGRVRFHGFLTQEALRPLVEQADVAVFASLHEAGPIAALEAAHAGVAVAGTAVGHLAEWAPEGARVARPGDAEGLADAIDALLTDDVLRCRVAARGQALATAWDADATADAVLRLYDEVARVSVG